MSEIPKINDPFVGPVFGNILDMYDSPTYSMKLYMVRPQFANSVSEKDFFITQPIAPEADTVVLAQTGVTGTQIDNVMIDALVMTRGGGQLTCKFTITQPGGATFLDEIQMAKGYLGYKNSSNTTLFLEIRFQGYTTDFEDNEEGGEPTAILGPILYKLNFTRFSVNLDATGSKYECESIIAYTGAYRDPVYRLQQTVTTTGATITEHVESLKKALNEWHTETTGHQVPDIIDIDLSQLIKPEGDAGDLTIIKDDTITTSKDSGKAETSNRVMNETFDSRTKLEQQAALESAPVDSGTQTEVVFDADNLSIKEGTTIAEFMKMLLSMCPEYYTKISRKENIDEAESKVKKDQAFVSWFKMESSVKHLAFDPSRRRYAEHYTYIPLLYKTANPNVAVDVEEVNLEPKEEATRVEQFIANGSLLKAYSYMFTGLNDQIINLDITYDSGNAAMLPPKYGAMGSIAQTSSNKFSDSTPAGEDTSFAGRLNSTLGKANEKADKAVFGDFVDALTEAGNEDILGSVAGQLGSKLGLDETDILTKLADKVGLNSLVESLDRETRNTLGGFGVGTVLAPGGTPASASPATESPDVVSAGPSAGVYTPEASGYIYSSDFIVQDSSQAIDASTLAELGYMPGGIVPPIQQSVESSVDIKSESEAATTQIGTTRNKLFSFITAQQNSGTFLTKLNFEVRGDPWYLAASDLSKPTDATANFQRDDMFFWLRIGSPQKFDPDYRDEDNNTGYWQFDGTSQTFSGVYRYIKVTNKFSGGIYTVDIESQRAHSLTHPLPRTKKAAADTDTDTDTDAGTPNE